MWENTLFIFTSDNGVAKGLASSWSNPIYVDAKDGNYGGVRTEKSMTASGRDHINGQGVVDGVPLRGKKGYCYEGGHRVPLLMHWPAKIQSRSVEQLIGLHDLYRTIAGLLEIEVGAGQAIDSVDLSSLVLTDHPESQRQKLLIQANRPSQSNNKKLNSWSFYTVEQVGDETVVWKALINNNRSTPQNSKGAHVTEMYRLSSDPGENQPITDAARSKQMLEKYKESL